MHVQIKKKRLSFLCLISQLVLNLGEDRRIFYWSENPARVVKVKVMMTVAMMVMVRTI